MDRQKRSAVQMIRYIYYIQQIIRLIEKIDKEINKEIDGLERSAVDSQIERDRQIDELDRQIYMVR